MFIYSKKTLRIASLVIAILCCLSVVAPVASARASLYISSYVAYVSSGGSGKVLITFEITGTGKMDEIGSTYIYVYENGTLVKTYSSTTTSGMMASNKVMQSNYITHQGTTGKTYSAFVVFKAGVNGGYDNRSMDTNSITA